LTALPVPRLPIGPDFLRRIPIPRDLEPITTISPDEQDPAAVGMTDEGVERIWRAAQSVFRSGVYPALTLCVRREGQVVLDRALGWARGNGPDDEPGTPTELAQPDTPFVIFSAAKAMTATLAHLLDERGYFHIDDRVSEYIPEYGRYGKDAITIEHVLSHRAGVPNLPGHVLDL
jgi:CubicO group peptidase (beta-lactamase class C family)